MRRIILFSIIFSIFTLNIFFTNCSQVRYPYATSTLTNQGPQLANNSNNCAPKTLNSNLNLQSMGFRTDSKISPRVF